MTKNPFTPMPLITVGEEFVLAVASQCPYPYDECHNNRLNTCTACWAKEILEELT